MSRRGALWEPIPKRQTASPAADQMGPATPVVAFQHLPDTLLQSEPFPPVPGLALGFPGHLRGRNNHPGQLSLLEVGKQAQRGQATLLRLHSRTWLGPRMSPQNCCPSEGGASAPPSHMPVASLAAKVTGRKLGFLKKVREGDARVGRPVSLPPPRMLSPLGEPHPLLSPQKPSLPPFSLGILGRGGHDPTCPPKPRTFCLCGCPPLPATWPSQRPVGSEAGGGLGCANGSPLPAILLPCLSHLCPPPPSPSITIPLPGPGESDGSRRPPPRGGGGARGRRLARGSEAVSPPPPSWSCSTPNRPPSAAALRTDGGGSCRGVCVRGEAVPGPQCPGAVSSSRDTAGEGGP